MISSLINRSFDESLMPECLKIGMQTPVFKGGDNILSNYRPITVVNSIAKVFEKAVNARLTKYLDKFNLLTDNQFGFRAQHATSYAMIKLYDEALTGLDNKSCKTGSVLLDISKALIVLIMKFYYLNSSITESEVMYANGLSPSSPTEHIMLRLMESDLIHIHPI